MDDRDKKALSDLNMAIALCGAEIALGGPGSGNWAHVGRPGKRGGSASRSSGGMSIARGRDWMQRQAAAKGSGGGGAKITGNGLYGNDGTATEKQIDYARSLVDKIPGDSFEGYYKEKIAPYSPIRRKALDALGELSSGLRRKNIGAGSFYEDDPIQKEKTIDLISGLYNKSIAWLRSVNLNRMSSSGASDFIDALKTGNAITAFVRAFKKEEWHDSRSYADFLNDITERNAFVVEYPGERGEHVRLSNTYLRK